MVFTDELLETKLKLESMGHEVFVSSFIKSFIGKNELEREELTLHFKNEEDAIRKFYETIKASDAVLVLNYYRRGIKDYIGGNTFLEIGFAYVHDKKIFLMNPIPAIYFYESEIKAMKPVVINGDLSKIS